MSKKALLFGNNQLSHEIINYLGNEGWSVTLLNCDVQQFSDDLLSGVTHVIDASSFDKWEDNILNDSVMFSHLLCHICHKTNIYYTFIDSNVYVKNGDKYIYNEDDLPNNDDEIENYVNILKENIVKWYNNCLIVRMGELAFDLAKFADELLTIGIEQTHSITTRKTLTYLVQLLDKRFTGIINVNNNVSTTEIIQKYICKEISLEKLQQKAIMISKF